ncbi:uncharacterized protein B0I36DRAFT_333337 [Microdochium trichocladiopsis]|uniref:Uncharacterized protein n=1 Tax=Microdochium trichocladiopsis TaxID=1682393 RepID=A0A9P9BNH4_9PEZI|nr:uncharacterized protein B0I36DRAFT_333337 [Microdochium trichocladiopsis]KAH7020878.1 hypothetical protein B0I36DRAFT_333337 [Microdochium trichocladiopsis]
MTRRDILEEPPAYDTLFDTREQLPNYASIAPRRQESPCYYQPTGAPTATTAAAATTSSSSCASSSFSQHEPRRGSDTSTCSSSSSSSSCSSAADKPEKRKKNKDSSSKKENSFLSKWRADLEEDRARRARRVVHISATEADRIMGLNQKPSPGSREVRWRVYYECQPSSEKRRQQ